MIHDLTLKGPLSVVLMIFSEIKHVLKEDAGLELAVSKTQILSKEMSLDKFKEWAAHIIHSEEACAQKSRYKHAIDVYILQAKLNAAVWKNIPNGENELDARIGVGSGTKILTNKSIYNHSVDFLLALLDVEEESIVRKGSDE